MHRPGYLQFDPSRDMEQVEIDMATNGGTKLARCMGRHAPGAAVDFKKYFDDITVKVVLDPEIAADVALGFSSRTKTASCVRTSTNMLTSRCSGE